MKKMHSLKYENLDKRQINQLCTYLFADQIGKSKNGNMKIRYKNI